MKDQTTNLNQNLPMSHHISLDINNLSQQHDFHFNVSKEQGINGILVGIDRLQQDVAQYLTTIIEEHKKTNNTKSSS